MFTKYLIPARVWKSLYVAVNAFITYPGNNGKRDLCDGEYRREP